MSQTAAIRDCTELTAKPREPKPSPEKRDGRGTMAEPSYPDGSHDYASNAEELERLEAAMSDAPRGAVAVSAVAVGLLILCWLAIYLLVFLPRGTVG